MNGHLQVTLGWALFDAAKNNLSTDARTRLCVKLGAGDEEEAIKDLMHALDHHHTALPLELKSLLRLWMSGYSGSDVEPHLRALIARLNTVRVSGTPPIEPIRVRAAVDG